VGKLPHNKILLAITQHMPKITCKFHSWSVKTYSYGRASRVAVHKQNGTSKSDHCCRTLDMGDMVTSRDNQLYCHYKIINALLLFINNQQKHLHKSLYLPKCTCNILYSTLAVTRFVIFFYKYRSSRKFQTR